MGSTNKTTHYELSQFLANDKPAWLSDYNNDMLKIDNAIYAVHEEAQEGGLPAGGTNGQVLTQTAGGTPTWADIPEAEQIAGNPILPNMTADQIAITMKNYNGNIDTLYQSGFYQIVSGATGTLPWSGVNGSVLQVAGNGTGVGTWQIISDTAGKVMARACTGAATWTSWKEVGSTIASGLTGNAVVSPLSGADVWGSYKAYNGNIDEMFTSGTIYIGATASGTFPAGINSRSNLTLITINGGSTASIGVIQIMSGNISGQYPLFFRIRQSSSWTAWMNMLGVSGATSITQILSVDSLPKSPTANALYLIPED